ncbi:hypothetical protein PoB_003873900 [Plakobranchus ocellatus]|uniref:Uncharacterized protein n=1 Tax=Plakobranchus ocellatus TaxID=259542 RepID=A0AAV4B0M3_9GAST|nr:hypothetical protein PoB_003873900 [Plakobranchus ocellatus]
MAIPYVKVTNSPEKMTVLLIRENIPSIETTRHQLEHSSMEQVGPERHADAMRFNMYRVKLPEPTNKAMSVADRQSCVSSRIFNSNITSLFQCHRYTRLRFESTVP